MPHYSRSNETSCIFEIRLDDKTVYRSQPLSDRDTSVPVRVPLGDAGKLNLYVRDVRDPNPLTCFVFPIFAEPILSMEQEDY